MKIGFIGLGKMGFNMRQRLRDAGHEVVGYDRNPDVADVDSIEAMVAELPKPRVVWSMLPAGKITHDTVVDLSSRLESGDVIVEGGNSRWTDDMANAEMLDKLGIGYVDCGVSGGVWGLQNGYALMVGGTEENVATVQPLFDSLKPPGEFGFVHAGMAGAGHYAKMVHNGIEYGMMQVFKSWRKGTVIQSWLLDLMDRALDADPTLHNLRGWAEDSGEGRWTLEAGIEHAVPLPVLAAALFARFSSRQSDSPTMKAVAALRNQFGGHAVQAEDPSSAKQTPVETEDR
jgi:6-phosphogluconate dehydrogenase